MWKEKSPGVKILWLWTIGTAAGTLALLLVANVVTTRMRDLQMQMNDQGPTPEVTEPVLMDNSSTDSSEFVREEI